MITIMVIAHITSFVLWLISLAFFGCVGSLYLLLSVLITPRKLHPLARFACRGVLFTTGQRLRIKGTFPATSEGPYIYIFNHSSILDTFVIVGAIPEFISGIGKREQFDVPLWGRIIRRWGVVPIDRGQLNQAINSLNQAEAAVKNGLSLVIAPEGTRTSDGTLGPFKKGPFHVALNSGATIVPLIIKGTFGAKNKNSWHLTPGTIELQVGAPIRPCSDAFRAVETLLETTREQFL